MRRGRHLYARRPRRTRWIFAAVLAVGAAGIGVAATARFAPSWLGIGGSPSPVPTPTPTGPACPTAHLAGTTGLGSVSWIRDGALHVLSLDTCEERVPVPQGASPPLRFSQDGTWIAFGRGTIVPTDGGTTQSPLGELSAWDWSPTEDELAGVTPRGGLVLGSPAGEPSTLMPDGSGAGQVAFSPNGRSLAVDVGGDRVAVIDLRGGARTTIYQVTSGTRAPPRVAGWSPDGRWVLFFSMFANRPGVPLNAAPTTGGSWVNVFDPILPYSDFLAWCRNRLVLSGGADRVPSQGSQILVSGPPGWRFANLSVDFSRSWIWPACSPDGRWVVATVMPNGGENPPGHGARSLWLLSTDGRRRARLTRSSRGAYELARWSADGRFLLAVRRGPQPDAPGVLTLLRVRTSKGKATTVVRTLARIGPSPGEKGHSGWSAITDWYQPR